MPAALRVGLTGGLASGKSTVAGWLADAGCTVVDADRLVAESYAAGAEGATAIGTLFGGAFLDATGAVDKAALAQLVFADDDARRRLEAAIHPLVRRRFRETVEALAGGLAVLEATRLVEAGFAADFDRIVTVEAPLAERLARAVRRGLSEADARARLAAQGDGAERRRAAHFRLENDGDLATLRRRVERLLDELRDEARRRGSGRAAAGDPATPGPGD